MIERDLKLRVARLVRGERRTEDLDRLFLGLRQAPRVGSCIREIGDFVAHRNRREKGLITRQAQDVFKSFRSWIHITLGNDFTLEDVEEVAVQTYG